VVSNGKLIVGGMLGIVLVWVAAGLLWKDAPDWPEDRDAQPVPPLQAEQEPDSGMHITDRKADGSVVVSNVPEGTVSRVEKSRQRRAAEAAARAAAGEEEEENPFDGFIDDGSPMTAAAMNALDMSQLDGSDPEYDPGVDARQRFNALELDLLAESPLTPESWKAITADHQEDLKGVFKRAKALSDADHPDDARALIEEWNELQGKYQAQAYGRSPQPVRSE
jgi:hypothetical protein